MAMLKTRYEKGQDATYQVNTAATVTGGRLVRIVAAGTSKTKPRVEHTSTDDGAQYSVGAASFDAAALEDVGVTHRGWMALTAAAAIVVNEDVYPAAAGKVRGAANVGATALSGSARPFGRSLHAAVADAEVWVKAYQR